MLNASVVTGTVVEFDEFGLDRITVREEVEDSDFGFLGWVYDSHPCEIDS